MEEGDTFSFLSFCSAKKTFVKSHYKTTEDQCYEFYFLLYKNFGFHRYFCCSCFIFNVLC